MENKSYNFVLNEILSKVLELSENPSQFADYLTQQIRELVGARNIVIAIREDSGQAKILSVFPVRRTNWANQGAVLNLAERTFDYKSVQFLEKEVGDENIRNFLQALEIDQAIAIPLIAANRLVGSILLLDIMDSYGIDSVIKLLSQLSGVFALVIRNSNLYQNMEDLVVIRTTELKKRNEELLEREQQLLVANEEYEVLNEELIESIQKVELINQELVDALSRAEKSESQAKDILQTAMDSFWIVDQQGCFLDVNEVACKMIGYSREEMLQMKIADIEVLETTEIIKSRIDKINKTGDDRFESKHRCKDGSVIDVEISTKLQGNRNLFVCFVRDITDRKKAEKELKESEFNLKKAQQMAHIGSWNWTMATDTVYWSEELFRFHGLEPKPQAPGFIEQDDLATPESRERLKAAIDKSIQNGESYEIELEHISRQDKNIKHTIARGEPVFDSYGKIIGFQGTLQDITDQKRVVDSLRQSEERWRRAVADSPVPIMIHDEDDKVLQLSAGWTKYSGYTIEDIPTLAHWTELAYGERSGFKKEYIDQLFLIDHTVENGEWVVNAKDGSKRIWDFQTTPLGKIHEGKRILHSMAIDITDRKQAEVKALDSQAKLSETLEMSNRARQSLLSVLEDQRRTQQEINKLNAELEQRVFERTAQLEAVNKELEAFSYSVSHDLRAPLRHISGFITLFLEDKTSQLTSEELEYLDVIVHSTEEMGKLIDALLSFSRLNRSELIKVHINTSEIINRVIKLFNQEIQARSIRIDVDLLPDTLADQQLINQVWTNLISNAIKYTGKKEKAIIEIGGYCENHETVFFIKDNGAGFNMKYADKLFTVFQRLHKPRDFEGIGIGLANIHRIVSRHGGRCWAQGEINSGATFYFSLPDK